MADRLSWLQTHTPLRSLSLAALEAIAAALRTEAIAANRRIVLEDTPVTQLIILRSGELEAYHTTRDRPAPVTTLLPGTVLHWPELVLEQRAPQTVITLTDCELWTLPREVFAPLAAQFPGLRQQVSQQLQSALSDLAHEQERQAVLRPYLVPRVKQGIVGSSRYAVRLRQGIKEAASDRRRY
ncbi:cyclic nucleotide-binding domain-containing protein [Thermosynechococcus sp.]|uniref:cyclic nucleotide-binding domain-containing protein n=1 Tax=Thermosynechococcus sp. TaxID=2814275 RepID=UPI00391BE7EF